MREINSQIKYPFDRATSNENKDLQERQALRTLKQLKKETDDRSNGSLEQRVGSEERRKYSRESAN